MKLTAFSLVILASIAIASAVRFDSAEPDSEDVSRSDETPRWTPRYHIVKRRSGKVRQIHVYPMKHRYSQRDDRRPIHTVSETHEHVGYVNPKDQENAAAESSKVEKMIDVDGQESHHNDNHIGESHHYEAKQRIKIKHHHHHHHHNHVKTVVKKEPYPVEKIVQVEKVVEKVIAVPKPYPVKEFIEKKIPYPVEKVVEKVVHVPKPYPVIKHIPVEIKVPVPFEKPIPYPVEKKVPFPVKVLVPIEKSKLPYHHHDHHHDHHHIGDYHSDYTNNKYLQVSATQDPQSSEQSASASAEYQQYLPRPEYLRATASALQEQQAKLFHASGLPYDHQQQLQQQVAAYQSQMRRDLLTRERLASGSEESENESSEFRPFPGGPSAEASNNVETVVPPPPNHIKRSQFHINVPNESVEQTDSAQQSGAASTNNQFTHNIEIPVHFYRLQPLESGEGFTISQ